MLIGKFIFICWNILCACKGKNICGAQFGTSDYSEYSFLDNSNSNY